MKLKKVLSICKTNGLYYLYDRIDRSGEITQWLGDGYAIYPLDGLPILDEESFCAVFDIIYAGIDVGGAHYSLTEHDQTELMAQFQTVKEGAKEVPYHADGELCRMYTAEEFTALTQAATAHVFYHRTYCNHLNAWIKRAGLDEIPAIVYGADLPADLAASMAALIEKAGGDA